MRLFGAALPNAAMLIMTPPDRVQSLKPPVSIHYILEAVREQLVIARDNGVAYFDVHGAMGGPGSMARIYRAGLADDMVHFTEKGGRYMGGRIASALWSGLARWLEANPTAGCSKL